MRRKSTRRRSQTTASDGGAVRGAPSRSCQGARKIARNGQAQNGGAAGAGDSGEEAGDG